MCNKTRDWVIWACGLPILALVSSYCQAQSIRSSFYDGNTRARYLAQPEFDPGVPMTIEAWVYRQDENRCEAIVSHGRADSYWFGFCNGRLRFYRSGGTYAEAFASARVPAYQWTHVAVNYTGSIAAFYIDGEAAGNFTLGNAGAGRVHDLNIGGDTDDTSNFLGYIDELRIWSESRNRLVVAAGMYQELRTGNLIGAWGRGAGTETTHGWLQIPAYPAPPQVFGILPRDLIIPRPAIPVTVDGQIDVGSEYVGAEQLVMRYRNRQSGVPTAPDAVAYLVHDDENLYVGFGQPRPMYGGTPSPYVGLMLDADHSQQNGLAGTMIVSLLDGTGGHEWRVADAGLGIFRGCQNRECPPLGSWQAVQGDCGDDVGSPCIEFRIARSLLGDWTQLDGLALGHFDVSPNGDLYLSPANAQWNIEASWPTASYVESTGGELPHGRISGRVFDNASPTRTRPLANALVYFGGRSGGPQYSQLTDSQGRYSFDVPIPIGMNVAVQLYLCEGCRQSTPIVAANGIQPILVSDHLVSFPGCDADSCTYANVDFFNQLPIPGTIITGTTPDSGTSELTVRTSSPVITIPATTVRIEGANLHNEAQLSIARTSGSPNPWEWEHYPASIGIVADDGSWLFTQMPQLPQDRSGTWRWVFEDEWVRPGYQRYVVSDPFLVAEPYPMVHGFGFDNEPDTATISDFFACYGYNAYLCVGAFGFCACHVPDPLYFLYYPIYAIWTNESGGSCMGMSGASLMMKRGLLDPRMFDDAAPYARGLIDNQRPAAFEWHACSPPDPTNIWGYIRMYHGAQTSAEAITYAMEQLNEGGGLTSWETSPTQRLTSIRNNPFRSVLSLSPSIGDGHVVVPWRVEEITDHVTRIHVYDNNETYDPPTPADHFVDIDTNTDRFTYLRPSGQVWSGRGMFTMPYSLFSGQRSAPGLRDIETWMVMFVFGDADSLVQIQGGSAEWGWRSNGQFVDNIPGALALNPLGPSDNPSRHVPLIIPSNIAGTPRVQINAHGGHYVFHAAGQGTLLQIEARNATAGIADTVRLGRLVQGDERALRSMEFKPHNAGLLFTPRIGMNLGLQQRAVFKISGLDIPAQSTINFAALPDRKGIEIASQAPVRYMLVTETVDGAAEESATTIFGPLDIPANAIQTVVFEDWPVCNEIRCELDIDGDGAPDEVSTLVGNRCGDSPSGPESDRNSNGIPDQCERTPGDMNCDGHINNFDINPFVTAISDPAGYASAYPDCLLINADINGDGLVNNFDINGFVACIESGGCAR